MTYLKQLTDEELMARLGTGDMAGLGELANRHNEKIVSLAYRMVGRWDSAEDIGQEAFLRIYKASKHYKPKAKFTTWMYRIVVNLCIDSQRKRSIATIPFEHVHAELAWNEKEGSLQRNETINIVQKAIKTLNERQRMAVILHRYDGLSHAEISDVTGWSKSAVESLLVRAYANLRTKLKELK